MLELRRSTQFKKDLRRILKQAKKLKLLEDIINELQNMRPLKHENRDHALVGEWNGYRECHITPDWLLIYIVDEDLYLLRLMRTGSHSELFK